MNPAWILLLLAAAAEARQYRAFWADAFHPAFKNPAEVDQLLDDVSLARANAVFVQMRRRGDVYFLQALEPPASDPAWSPAFDPLDYLVRRAHERGIEVHAWMVVGPAWSAGPPPPDPKHVWNQHGPQFSDDRNWMTAGSRGELSYSLDPGHPDAARYLADVIVEPARHYDLDGIHLDYIRYPEVDTAGRSAVFGWNPKAIERFQRLNNRIGRPDAADAQWADFRRAQVTGLVRQIYLRAYAIRPSIKISAALITWGDAPPSDADFVKSSAYSRVFQDWRGWLEEGIIDLGIPMNYFAETRYSAWLDRWLEFEKDRQYGRAIMPGLGVYLSSIPDSLSQIRRVLSPSAAGNRAIGVNFYSYASTNLLTSGAPTQPNVEFYRAVSEVFGDAVPVPALAWKSQPSRAQLYGWVEIDGGPAWLKDGASIAIESDTADRAVRTTTDGTGFFGAVDLPPDRYRIRIERGGQEIFRTVAQEAPAGAALLFHVFLKAADFSNVLPRLAGASKDAAAPGDLLVLSGANFGDGAQVLANGQAAALLSWSANSLMVQLPLAETNAWRLLVRRAGMESEPLDLRAVPAAPLIRGVRRVQDVYLEIYATGLGILGGQPVTVMLGGAALDPLYAGPAPGLPAVYQVNVRLPDGVTAGAVRLRVGDVLSDPVSF